MLAVSCSWERGDLMYTARLRYHALAAVLVFSIHYLIEIEGIISILQMKKQVQKVKLFVPNITYLVWNRISLAFF